MLKFLTAPLTLLTFLSLAPTALAQTATDLAPLTPRGTIDYRSSSGGYDGFGGIEGFIPLFQTPGRHVTYLDGRFNLDNGGHVGGNLLLGHRALLNDTILGGYVGYDVRDTGSTTFHQVGVGVEALWQDWQLHLNGYLPVGDTRKRIGSSNSSTSTSTTNRTITDPSTSITDPFFEGNNLILSRSITGGSTTTTTTNTTTTSLSQFEAALGGVDLELGKRLATFKNGGDVRGFGGVYFYDGEGVGGHVGGRARLEMRPTNYLNLGLGVQHDELFGTNLLLSIAATFPTRSSTNSSEADSTAELWAQAASPIRRLNTIPVDTQTGSTTTTTETTTNTTTTPGTTQDVLATTTTGDIYVFRHVTPATGNATGTGTFEDPNTTVAGVIGQTATGDIVYVSSGNAGGAFTIPDGVQILSVGPNQQIATQLGTVTLPSSGQGDTARPTLSGAVTLGNNTVLSGFDLSGAGVTGNNVQNVSVLNNQIANSTVNFANVIGNVAITNNSLTGSPGQAILLDNNAGQTTLTLSSNTINNSANDGIRLNFEGSADVTAVIDSNTIDTVTNATDTSVDGIDIEVNGASIFSGQITNNIISNLGNSGIELETCGTITVCSSTFNVTVNGNQVTNAGGDGILFFHNSNTAANLTLTNNTVSNSGVSMSGVTNNPAASSLPLPAALSSGNGGLGIGVFSFADGDLTLLLNGNQVSNSQDEKIFVGANIATAGTSQVSAQVTNNTLSGTGTSFVSPNTDLSVVAANGGTICLQLEDNIAPVTNNFFTANGLETVFAIGPVVTPILPAGAAFNLEPETGNGATVVTSNATVVPQTTVQTVNAVTAVAAGFCGF
ncbi:MAG: right-handed parallel beta-helix repeat-containing protein [Leptolyngbya sp. SIO3F4]|nr:right-handed parallel beta-helix repeat-containing protein [Leptolyngbya sp. SIO3F4]